jgi:hypothetical protein
MVDGEKHYSLSHISVYNTIVLNNLSANKNSLFNKTQQLTRKFCRFKSIYLTGQVKVF